VKKFFHGHVRRGGVERLCFYEIQIFERVVEQRILDGFWRSVFGVTLGSGGEEWCVGREVMRIIFWGSVGVGN
jgi:hypothetical protein